MALDSWAGRPREGRALLGGVRDVPLLSYSRAPVRHRLVQRGDWRLPRVRIGTDRDPRSAAPPRRGAPSRRPGCIPPPAARRYAWIAPHARAGSVSPHAVPTEGTLRSAATTVPGGANEPRLFMPWLGRTSTFFDQRIRLALTNEATPLGRSAGPRKRFPFSLVPGRPQRP